MQEVQEKSRHAAQDARPAVSVVLPGALVTLFPGSTTQLTVNAATVDELLQALDNSWPGMRDRLRDSRPSIRKHINIFVDGRRASLDTPLAAGSRVHVLTAMSGG